MAPPKSQENQEQPHSPLGVGRAGWHSDKHTTGVVSTQAWRVTLQWVTATKKKVCGAGVPPRGDPGEGWLCFQDLKAQKKATHSLAQHPPSGSLGWFNWTPFVLVRSGVFH